MTGPSSGLLRRIDLGMAAAGLLALGCLVVEHGLLVADPWRQALLFVEAACVLLFAGLQAAKLLVVDRPAEYLRSHRLDFALLLLLIFQILALAGLLATPESRYFESRGLPSPLSAFYVGTLQVYLVVIVGLRSPLLHRLLVRLRLRPVQMLVASFLGLVALGTVLLALPGASLDGRRLPLIDALFTSTSAVCVTGLVVRDTGTQFSPIGLAALLGLIQAGGLGILTITASFALFGGRGMSREEARALVEAMNVGDEPRMRREFGRLLVTALIVEALGAGLLFLVWREEVADPLVRGAWAAFHSVSAFCNAGFSLFPGNISLTAFATDPVTLAVIGALIVLGGLGFGVLSEAGSRLAPSRRRGPRLPLTRHGRWVLRTTAVLLVAGTAAIWLAEYRGVLAPLEWPDAWTNAAFQSVTLRTAGFNSVDFAGLGLPAVTLAIALMLIGGSPASAAGGMKTTTAAVSLAGLLRLRVVERQTARRALRLAATYLVGWAAFAALLALAQGGLDRRIAFEAASALGTVGLTMGLTDELTAWGKIVVCAAMFAGRVGPFAIAAALFRLRPRPDDGAPGERILLS